MPYADFQGIEGESLSLDFDVVNEGGTTGTEEVEFKVHNLSGGTKDGETTTPNPVDTLTYDFTSGGTISGEQVTWSTGSNEGSGYYKAHIDTGEADDIEVIAEIGPSFNEAMWVLAGNDGGADSNNVQRFSGGSWDEYSSGATALNNVRDRHVADSYEGYLYHASGSATDNTVERFDGSSWEEFTSGDTAIPSGVERAASAVYDGYWYVTGGKASGGAWKGVQRFDGSSWEEFTSGDMALSKPRQFHSSAVYEGDLYVLGGSDGNNKVSGIDVFTGGQWSLRSGSYEMDEAVNWARAAVYDGYLYVVGGRNTSNSDTARVQRFDGSSWESDNANGSGSFDPLNTKCIGHATAVHDGHLYVYGGQTGGSVLTEVQKFDGSSWVSDNVNGNGSHDPLPTAVQYVKGLSFGSTHDAY
jgi:hypothetical protein